jgi:oligopeptide/dipeptide ABC transporter ATP-binding protein
MARIYGDPGHPYTIGLLRSIPDIGRKSGRLQPIAGSPQVLSRPPAGCSFRPRCPWRAERCDSDTPALEEVAPGHAVACHFAAEVRGG